MRCHPDPEAGPRGRRPTVAGDGASPYKRDLKEGAKGLSGNCYVVAELDTSHRDADGKRVPGLERVPVRIRTPRRCDHCETVCVECAESWMFDWVFYFDRTAGGRRLRAGLGGDEALAVMARRRADWENRHRSAGDGTAGPDSRSQAGEQPK
ncbi:MAG: hypothetical protein M3Z75_32930 [Actinomycetota bacterium]|nr:hypothetical protein [Actinomycetota bacterium]